MDALHYDHRGWTQDVQQEGHTAALNGEARDNNPYSPSHPGANHWIYGFMLGTHDRKMKERNHESE